MNILVAHINIWINKANCSKPGFVKKQFNVHDRIAKHNKNGFRCTWLYIICCCNAIAIVSHSSIIIFILVALVLAIWYLENHIYDTELMFPR